MNDPIFIKKNHCYIDYFRFFLLRQQYAHDEIIKMNI